MRRFLLQRLAILGVDFHNGAWVLNLKSGQLMGQDYKLCRNCF